MACQSLTRNPWNDFLFALDAAFRAFLAMFYISQTACFSRSFNRFSSAWWLAWSTICRVKQFFPVHAHLTNPLAETDNDPNCLAKDQYNLQGFA